MYATLHAQHLTNERWGRSGCTTTKTWAHKQKTKNWRFSARIGCQSLIKTIDISYWQTHFFFLHVHVAHWKFDVVAVLTKLRRDAITKRRRWTERPFFLLLWLFSRIFCCCCCCWNSSWLLTLLIFYSSRVRYDVALLFSSSCGWQRSDNIGIAGIRIVEFSNSSSVSVDCDWTVDDVTSRRRAPLQQPTANNRPIHQQLANGGGLVADNGDSATTDGLSLTWLDANRQPVVSIPGIR